ncbi:hypothetical protein KZZ52_47915 [Dactylosporangium sp. AC04546]|uniref:hypothetical protein n=1 Tax=Dactylosporangium sp. AC04546 TaxID=2862460 RepID=UPI001EDFF334|nr:hypothetical protein [Dactylosporangium sp. AC04546]WVK81633.1 hypothetical protein KZZ52_47915 [Dactylosporangium sp. AC04546]
MLLLTAVLLAACGHRVEGSPPPPPDSADPGSLVEAHTARVSRDGPYRDPTDHERAQAREAVRQLLDRPGDGAALGAAFGALGYTAAEGADPATGRPYRMFSMSPTEEPAWGILLVDRSAPPRVVVEVPHPGFDTNTDKLGVAVHRLVPGAVLLVAGAHRAAGGGAADVAHNSGSMFHTLATAFAERGLPQVQLHGFADTNRPEAQVVVSAGAGAPTRLARELATGLERDAGLVVRRAWEQRRGRLEGTGNDQGRAAAALGAEFVHLELGWVIRRDPRQRAAVARTLAGLLTA